MAIQLGINPLTWTNDDLPTLGAETSLETCLTEGRQAGFAGFELGNKFPRKADVLGPILKLHDLQKYQCNLYASFTPKTLLTFFSSSMIFLII